MKNIILILTAALSLMAEEPTNPSVVDVEGTITLATNYLESFQPIEAFRDATISETFTNVTWRLSESPTNKVVLAPWIKTETNWATIERITNASPVLLRQIGHVQTNQMLTLIYQGRTNHLVIGVIGKSEWPDQKQVIPEPIRQQNVQVPTRKK